MTPPFAIRTIFRSAVHVSSINLLSKNIMATVWRLMVLLALIAMLIFLLALYSE